MVDQKPVIQAAFRRLKALYPDIRFPAHVYFVVGPQKGAGMNSDNGIILAADMFATPPGTPYSYTKVSPVYVPFSAVHETIHFNQAYQTSDRSTLLQNVVSEGTADFIASLVLPRAGGAPIHGPLAIRLRARGCTGSASGARRGPDGCGALDVQPQPAHGLAAGHGLLDGLPHRSGFLRAGEGQDGGPASHAGRDGLQGLSQGERLSGAEGALCA